MTVVIWILVIIAAFEAMIFGNGDALIIGLILSVVGIYLEWRKIDVL